MRGVVAAGMASALVDLNAEYAFDAVYSVSAGSCIGAYFLSGQGDTTIYHENINNSHFIDPFRPLRSREPIVDINYLTHDVMTNVTPLDGRQILKNPTSFHIYTTTTDGEIADHTDFRTPDEIHNALRATCALPILAGKPVRGHDGRLHTDGGVATGGIALGPAIADGCTHIVALLTKPADRPKREKTPPIEKIAAKILQREFPQLASLLLTRYSRYAEALDRIEEPSPLYPQAGDPFIEAVRLPAGSGMISMMEKRRGILVEGAQAGYDAAMRQFASDNVPVTVYQT